MVNPRFVHVSVTISNPFRSWPPNPTRRDLLFSLKGGHFKEWNEPMATRSGSGTAADSPKRFKDMARSDANSAFGMTQRHLRLYIRDITNINSHSMPMPNIHRSCLCMRISLMNSVDLSALPTYRSTKPHETRLVHSAIRSLLMGFDVGRQAPVWNFRPKPSFRGYRLETYGLIFFERMNLC
jgi:hypothetical protein